MLPGRQLVTCRARLWPQQCPEEPRQRHLLWREAARMRGTVCLWPHQPAQEQRRRPPPQPETLRLALHLPSPSPTALLPPQASPPSRMLRLPGDGHCGSGQRFGLCAELLAAAVTQGSERNSARMQLPDRWPEMGDGAEQRGRATEALSWLLQQCYCVVSHSPCAAPNKPSAAVPAVLLGVRELSGERLVQALPRKAVRAAEKALQAVAE